MPSPKTSLSKNFSEWYHEVILRADLADYGPVRGTMIIKPYGYALWEAMQTDLDARIYQTGARNAYFPVFIPESFLKKEKEHVEGFSPELAVVTIAGGQKLTEPVVVRPTSETIIHDSFSKWISSYRDLPLKINQWANVVRWELRTRLFLRTTEFLWQEGHCAFATEQEAGENMREMLEVYEQFMREVLALPVITGVKSESEKFAGALVSATCEGLMRDGKALQMGTSHNLGTNFSKVFDVQYLDQKGKRQYAWLSSWGVSTRLIGAVIMAHGDDRGLVLPPEIAPIHAVIVPIYKTEAERKAVERLGKQLVNAAEGIVIEYDGRTEVTPGFKFNDWELKGVPVRVELGPREVAAKSAVLVRRDTGEKKSVKLAELSKKLPALLDTIQASLLERAEKFLAEHTFQLASLKDVEAHFKKKGGFVIAGWCGKAAHETEVKTKTGATIRAIPFTAKKKPCLVCGSEGREAYFAKAY